jgi:hypothetical protein
MERKLEDLVRDGLLRPRTSRTQPEWRVSPYDHRELAPPEGYVVSFISFHERGFGVLASPFMWALLHYYKVELHHLAPRPRWSVLTPLRSFVRSIEECSRIVACSVFFRSRIDFMRSSPRASCV